MQMQTVVQRAASLILAIQNCQKPGSTHHPDYPAKHIDVLETLAREYLPRGSGFDNGSMFDVDASRADCLVINTSFHHMDDNGYYCGWSNHVIRVRAHLAFGFTVSVSGRNVRDIKDYIADTFSVALSETVKE